MAEINAGERSGLRKQNRKLETGKNDIEDSILEVIVDSANYTNSASLMVHILRCSQQTMISSRYTMIVLIA